MTCESLRFLRTGGGYSTPLSGYSIPVSEAAQAGTRVRMEVEQAVVKLNAALNGRVELTCRAWREVNRRCEALAFSRRVAIESVYDDIVSGRLK